MKTAKITTVFLLLVLFAPNFSFASENLFYYFPNKNGLSSFKSNKSDIDIIAPQIYTVGNDLKVEKLSKEGKKILREAKNKNVKVMPLLVNKNFNKVLMSSILINPEAQDEIIDFMIKEAQKNNFIGWQFDFENLNHLDRDMYTAFVKKTYEKMKENNLQFSVAVVVRANDYDPNSKNQDWSSGYDYKELAKHSDFLSFMTYDDPNSYGPVASMIYVEKILNYMQDKVPAEKTSLGIPAYCWQWQEGPKKKIANLTYDLAQKTYKKGKNKSTGFDDYFGAQWFRYTKDKQDYEIWCDNKKSWELKLDLVEKFGLKGTSVWALGQEDKNIWKVLD